MIAPIIILSEAEYKRRNALLKEATGKEFPPGTYRGAKVSFTRNPDCPDGRHAFKNAFGLTET